jgi:hypothetical protein
MTNLIGMCVMEVLEYDISEERRENLIAMMGRVAGCHQGEDDTYCYFITWEGGSGEEETWSGEEVRNGNQLYESAVNLWTPNRSNYMNERVAFTQSRGGEVERGGCFWESQWTIGG